jgi:RES domain-containing protein
MRVYRIAKQHYIQDLSGEGARLYGGRWNNKGTKILYTAESRSLATVEYLVHVPLQIIPKDVYIAEIDVPDTAIGIVEVASLEKNWQDYPSPTSIRDIGDKWQKDSKGLLLRVPSAVIKNEWNVLINPEHSQFNEVKIVAIEPYIFDARLLNRN